MLHRLYFQTQTQEYHEAIGSVSDKTEMGCLATTTSALGAVAAQKQSQNNNCDKQQPEPKDSSLPSTSLLTKGNHLYATSARVPSSWISSTTEAESNHNEKKQKVDPQIKNRTSKSSLLRRRTIERMSVHSTKVPLESKYIWHKDKVLGEGAYGSVYLATDKSTEEPVALKQISKKHTKDAHFQREMKAMIYIRSQGGHPHLCSLHEHFNSPKYYYVVLDYIGGGEMFDHLINNGAYSEWDASRLVREVASALNFLHGIGVVHADLKPENILLTTSRRGDAVVKLADFGCAQVTDMASAAFGNEEDEKYTPTYGAPTPAYCPPESILKTVPIQASADMWGLGVILFIMLTGAHPYDLEGEADDDEIETRIKNPKYRIPINDPAVTGHLSKSAKDLISKLMIRDPKKRLTAMQMLNHPWVKGETAATNIMKGSDAKLSKYRVFKSKLQAKFFENVVMDSDSDDDEVRRKTSLLERSFKALDANHQGYLDIEKLGVTDESGGPTLTMSDFQNLLSTNIIHKHFPAGHVMYAEGDIKF